MEKRQRRSPELPDDIIQHIQSFLETEEAAQTRLVSKSWLRAWFTRPFLIFSPWLNNRHGPISDVINRTLKSYVDRGLPIVKFHVIYYAIQKRWFKMLRQSNVIELCLTSHFNWRTSFIQEIFQIKSLQVLSIAPLECINFLIVLNHSDIKCLNLRKLELRNIRIREVTFQHILSLCPLIEELLFTKCYLIDFPSYNRGIQSFMFAGECASLKRLSLVETIIGDEQLQTIMSKSPQLEDLKLIGCSRKLLIKLLKDLSYDRENLECCSFNPNKCWRHSIKDPKLYYVVDNEKRPLDVNGLKKWRGNKKVITLALEWESSH